MATLRSDIIWLLIAQHVFRSRGTSEPQTVALASASTLGLSFSSASGPTTQLLDQIRDKHILLVGNQTAAREHFDF